MSISLTVLSNATSFESIKRFPATTTIGELKGKLELLTGCSSTSMMLELLNGDTLVATLTSDNETLDSIGVKDGMKLKVTDNSKSCGDFEDVSQVEKYVMSDEKYATRDDSVLAFKMRNKLGQFSDSAPKTAEKAVLDEEEVKKSYPLNGRCEVKVVSNQTPKRGCVMFVGKIDKKDGLWIGVRYDEPVGKNDGSAGGKRYFECPNNYGAFVRPSSVTVGDFPEVDIDDEI